jgi:hypothetical protein
MFVTVALHRALLTKGMKAGKDFPGAGSLKKSVGRRTFLLINLYHFWWSWFGILIFWNDQL